MVTIEADGLTKIFKLYDRPSARLSEIFTRKKLHREFISLDHLSFRVNQGETLGIIGENGAGKSTLLKILSKTLSPSSGHFAIHGRVSSLLELGAGFHPEFTGLENIYFYGSLLGIDRALMDKKKEEIIEFSELGDFIHFPVKTYSSGMFVRLAFSVATSVDPEILILDEVLSVGDLHFQKKSTDRILSFKERGKTIVFCSHEMYHIARVCDRVLWLKNGRIHMEDKPFEVIQAYETFQLAKEKVSSGPVTEGNVEIQKAPSEKPDEKPFIFIQNLLVDPPEILTAGGDLRISLQTMVNDDRIPYRIAIYIRTVDGLGIIGTGTYKMDPFYGNQKVTILFPKIQLRSSTFLIEAFAFDNEGVYWYDRRQALPLVAHRQTVEVGIIDLPHEWHIEKA
ncbi:MAG: ABC transporter ATP-binding protein [Nitrospirae bacterium]|nr:ABC transporter ATP-binding protein [Nitrospirota bacterium]